MRLCLVNDSSHNPNWGCRATSTALREGLEGAGHEVVTTIYLEELQGLTPADRRSTRRVTAFLARYGPRRPFVRALAATAYDKVRPHLPDVVPADRSGLERAEDRMLAGAILESMLERLRPVDGVVVNGEGAVYGAQRKGRALMLLAHVAKERLGKWVGLVNHTADLADPAMAAFAERVYPTLDLVTFRDGLSLAACAAFLPGGRLVPDAAFTLTPSPRDEWLPQARRPGYFDVWPDRARFDPERPYVAVGGSALLVRAAGSPEARAGFAALAAALLAAGTQVVLTASDVPDERLFRPLAAEFGLPLIGLATPVPQALDVLAGADVYVGGRWHPAIFALLGGTPFVPLSSSSHKLRALAEEFGMPQPAGDALDLGGSVARVTALVAEHRLAGDALRARLRAAAAEHRLEAAALPGLVPLSRGAAPTAGTDGRAVSAAA